PWRRRVVGVHWIRERRRGSHPIPGAALVRFDRSVVLVLDRFLLDLLAALFDVLANALHRVATAGQCRERRSDHQSDQPFHDEPLSSVEERGAVTAALRYSLF